MRLFDAHSHLQDERFAGDLDELVAEARKQNITRFACCGTNEADWPRVASLAARYDEVIPSYGLHPWEVPTRSAGWLDGLRLLLERDARAGVGEIGLDFAIKDCDRAQQEACCLEQIELAGEFDRPLSFHCRRSVEAMTKLLQHTALPKRGFVIHSYSGGPDYVEALAALGGYFSFSGTSTFSRNKKAQRSIAVVPRDRLLVETDAPDMYPYIPGERRPPGSERPRNVPANLIHPVNALARLLELSPDELAALTYANACRLFLSDPREGEPKS